MKRFQDGGEMIICFAGFFDIFSYFQIRLVALFESGQCSLQRS